MPRLWFILFPCCWFWLLVHGYGSKIRPKLSNILVMCGIELLNIQFPICRYLMLIHIHSQTSMFHPIYIYIYTFNYHHFYVLRSYIYIFKSYIWSLSFLFLSYIYIYIIYIYIIYISMFEEVWWFDHVRCGSSGFDLPSPCGGERWSFFVILEVLWIPSGKLLMGFHWGLYSITNVGGI